MKGEKEKKNEPAERLDLPVEKVWKYRKAWTQSRIGKQLFKPLRKEELKQKIDVLESSNLKSIEGSRRPA